MERFILLSEVPCLYWARWKRLAKLCRSTKEDKYSESSHKVYSRNNREDACNKHSGMMINVDDYCLSSKHLQVGRWQMSMFNKIVSHLLQTFSLKGSLALRFPVGIEMCSLSRNHDCLIAWPLWRGSRLPRFHNQEGLFEVTPELALHQHRFEPTTIWVFLLWYMDSGFSVTRYYFQFLAVISSTAEHNAVSKLGRPHIPGKIQNSPPRVQNSMSCYSWPG